MYIEQVHPGLTAVQHSLPPFTHALPMPLPGMASDGFWLSAVDK